MEKEAFIELVEANPVVAAIKDDDGLKRCLESDIDVVFVLYGDVISIRDIVHRLKKGNKTVLVHVDLISGLAPKEVSVDFIRKYTEADGIITTRRNLTEYAKSLGMNTVLRYFTGSGEHQKAKQGGDAAGYHRDSSGNSGPGFYRTNPENLQGPLDGQRIGNQQTGDAACAECGGHRSVHNKSDDLVFIKEGKNDL
jgi:hypothetical protein